jgi:hypothetical protein
MWRYCGATFFILIGALELILALNKRMRDEIMKNSPVPVTRAMPLTLFFAALSAFAIALGLLFYNRFI